ncbi:MAG: lipid-A-disaccharide synthase [Alphaproteobacteria bacterium]|nr:lipid-A-disaccharide synthase [Alphaproteobacteria bacterium]
MSVDPPLVFLVAGEPSSDIIGGRLMAALKREAGGGLRFAGIGGPRMATEGLASRFPMEELSLVGFTNVIPRMPRLWRRMREVAASVRAERPAVVVFIDASGFARGVARRLVGSGIPLVQYKAPQAWAYWPWRARRMARYFDRTLVILPFEPEFFARYGARTTFIGHPALETGASAGDGAAFRARHGIGPADPVLCLMHGSRRSETSWSLPDFRATVDRLGQRVPGLRLIVPVIEPVAAEVRRAVAAWAHPAIVAENAERYDAMAASDVGLAVSGTATVELAVAGVPSVVCYRASLVSGFLGILFAQIGYVSIVNLVLGRPVMEELIQFDCRPDRLAESCARLFADPTLRQRHRAAYREAVARLDAGRPSTVMAALAIAAYLEH